MQKNNCSSLNAKKSVFSQYGEYTLNNNFRDLSGLCLIFTKKSLLFFECEKNSFFSGLWINFKINFSSISGDIFEIFPKNICSSLNAKKSVFLANHLSKLIFKLSPDQKTFQKESECDLNSKYYFQVLRHPIYEIRKSEFEIPASTLKNVDLL